jgi:hypothetical protein
MTPVLDLSTALFVIAADVLDQTIECLQACDALERSNHGACVVCKAVDRDLVGVRRVVDEDAHTGRVALRRQGETPRSSSEVVVYSSMDHLSLATAKDGEDRWSAIAPRY